MAARVGLVTGASRGIGRAVAIAFAREGADIAIAYLSEDRDAQETARWVERFTKLFEPLLMAFIGLIIGGIVVLMYFPIFDLAGSIQ